MAHLRWRNNSKAFSKFVLALVQLSLAFRAGSLDVGDAPTSGIIPDRVALLHLGDEGGVLSLLPPCKSDKYYHQGVMELVSTISHLWIEVEVSPVPISLYVIMNKFKGGLMDRES
jgi:hypothetical protein